MPEDVFSLCQLIQVLGRKVNRDAVWRLVRYWYRRTLLSIRQVCEIIADDVRRGRAIGLKKHGFE